VGGEGDDDDGMNALIKIPELSPANTQHPAVVKLLEVLHQQVLIIQQQGQTIDDQVRRLSIPPKDTS